MFTEEILMKYPEKHPPLPSAPVLTVKIYTQSRQSYLKKMSLFHLICWQNFSIFFRLTPPPPPHPPYKTYIFLLNFKELIGVNLQKYKKMHPPKMVLLCLYIYY